MDRPQSFTFEKPDTASKGVRRRHHTLLWPTPACLAPDCRRLWAATASFDIGTEISQSLHLPTHRIDLIIDNGRTLIASDLAKVSGMFDGPIRVTTPRVEKKCCWRCLLSGCSRSFTVDALVFTANTIVPPNSFIAACVRELCHTQRNTSLDLKRLFGLPT